MTPPNIEMLRPRADLMRQLRQFFDSREFLEVQTPCLSHDCVVDAYIDPIAVSSSQFQLGLDLPERYFLQTSPEAAMKRLLAAGSPSIYSLGPVFRSGERGDFHNTEFTMLEWYEVGASLKQGVSLLGELATTILSREGYDVVTYRNLFRDSLNIDPIECSIKDLEREISKVDPSFASTIRGDRDAILDVLLTEVIQPNLGKTRPAIIINYPLTQAALAKVADDDPQCAARFELFVDGVELANGYDELQDADVLCSRNEIQNKKRIARGRPPIQIDSGLIRAMEKGFPKCAGVALGVDRLLMLISGRKSIEKVISFPIEIA